MGLLLSRVVQLSFSLTLSGVLFAQIHQPTVTLVTLDIDNFWKAYDAGRGGDLQGAINKFYLGPSSPGLRDFLKLRIGSAKALATAVDREYPKFFASIRPYTLQVESQRTAVLKYLERYRELFPEAHFPTVYFVIGRLTSGGTTSDRGLLIGTEVFSLGNNVDTSEIAPNFRNAMGTIDRLPLVVVHELTHTPARPSQSKLSQLLMRCIGEGAADFVTELVAGGTINSYNKEWAESRREEIFQRFARDLVKKPADSNRWLYNYNSNSGEPPDLGYWIGSEICRSHYDLAEDKSQAVRDIVRLKDVEAIVRNSKYAWLLEHTR